MCVRSHERERVTGPHLVGIGRRVKRSQTDVVLGLGEVGKVPSGDRVRVAISVMQERFPIDHAKNIPGYVGSYVFTC